MTASQKEIEKLHKLYTARSILQSQITDHRSYSVRVSIYLSQEKSRGSTSRSRDYGRHRRND